MKLSHFNNEGNAHMVDTSEKSDTKRKAIASGKILLSKEAFELVEKGQMKKGDVLAVARIAGIMAMKQTSSLIPLCHPLFITGCELDFNLNCEENSISALATCKTTGKTGVEMEALTGVSVALLTIYDMCKAVDKKMEITDIRLEEKEGGKSGKFVNRKI